MQTHFSSRSSCKKRLKTLEVGETNRCRARLSVCLLKQHALVKTRLESVCTSIFCVHIHFFSGSKKMCSELFAIVWLLASLHILLDLFSTNTFILQQRNKSILYGISPLRIENQQIQSGSHFDSGSLHYFNAREHSACHVINKLNLLN